MNLKRIWTKILGYRVGDKIRIIHSFYSLPFEEKGKIGEIVERSSGRGDVYLVKIGAYLVWLNEAYFEKI